MDVEKNLRRWLLTADERGNRFTRIDAQHRREQAWSTGNHARPLVHGATYFAELYDRIQATRAGDLIFFTDWRGDPDEQLTDDPDSTVYQVLAASDQRGVDVRGLVWRSHRDDPSRDIAYLGGIDLCHSRRDDARHLGDPQPQPMAAVYGDTPPWHDVQIALSGPVVHDVETVFRERWEDPNPLTRHPGYRLRDKIRGMDTTPDPLPAQAPPPPPVAGATHAVQLLRTYPHLGFGRAYRFAPKGERSVARGYSKAIKNASSLIYIEDQYLWSGDVAESFVEELKNSPGLHVIAVVPHFPDQDSAPSRIPQELGRHRALSKIIAAAPDRVALYGIENHEGTPVYVHAKVCVIDDQWAVIGSDNFNRRSWTHDSELSAVVMDSADPQHSAYARRLRLTLAAEHLDRELGPDTFPGDISVLEKGREPADLDDSVLLEVMGDCIDPVGMFEAYAASAKALQAWHDGGKQGPRPPGRLRPLEEPSISTFGRALSDPPYRTIHDPDGRPRRLRRGNHF